MLDWHSCQTCYPLEKKVIIIIIILCKTQTGPGARFTKLFMTELIHKT